MDDYMALFMSDVIIYPCPGINASLANLCHAHPFWILTQNIYGKPGNIIAADGLAPSTART